MPDPQPVPGTQANLVAERRSVRVSNSEKRAQAAEKLKLEVKSPILHETALAQHLSEVELGQCSIRERRLGRGRRSLCSSYQCPWSETRALGEYGRSLPEARAVCTLSLDL